MFENRIGGCRVPARAFLTENEAGDPCVGRDPEGYQDEADESVLDGFLGLAAAPAEVRAQAVVGLVERFGPLSLCEPHHRSRWTFEHSLCAWLYPEPIRLWVEHAERVESILAIHLALEARRNPDLAGAEPVESGLYARMRTEVERRGRLLGATRDQLVELHDLILGWEGKARDLDRRVKRQLGTLRELQPVTVTGWRGWIAERVTEQMMNYPISIRLGFDERSSTMRPTLNDGAGLLGRLYFELALRVSGAAGAAFCSACGGAYTTRRKPKSGQANFCPECRAGGAAQRLHMRRKRSADSPE